MTIRRMSRCALLAALMCLCGWISVPAGTVCLTMQSFGVFLTVLLLGGLDGTVALLLYLLLGIVGLPVFSGGRGGLGVLLGPTGGYLLGFALLGLLYWLLEEAGTFAFADRHRVGALLEKPFVRCALGLAACYLSAAVWYHIRCQVPLSWAFAVCVVPYLLPDGLKLWLAICIHQRLRPLFHQ